MRYIYKEATKTFEQMDATLPQRGLSKLEQEGFSRSETGPPKTAGSSDPSGGPTNVRNTKRIPALEEPRPYHSGCNISRAGENRELKGIALGKGWVWEPHWE